MARKNVISAHPMLTDGDMTADLTSSSTDIKNLDNASIRITWTTASNPVGEIKVQVLQEKDNTPFSDSDWFDLDLGSTITIDNSESEHQIIFTQLPFDKIRIKYVATSGTGVMNVKISAKQVGG